MLKELGNLVKEVAMGNEFRSAEMCAYRRGFRMLVCKQS